MKALATKSPKLYLLLALCMSVVPAALGQSLSVSASPATDGGAELTWQKLMLQPSSQKMQPPQKKIAGYISANYMPPTPEQQAAMEQAMTLIYKAAADQHAGRSAQAEAEARQFLSFPGAPNVLALALESEGKMQEALQVYRSQIITQDQQAQNMLPYALLLLNSGHWVQALAAYNTVLPSLGNSELEQISSRFSPDDPQPAALEVAIHLERGRLYNAQTDAAGEPQSKEAFAEYGKALQLAPNSALTNYYYGVGWNKLSWTEQHNLGSFQQAKAALEKAVKLAKGPIKSAAQKALRVAMRTK